jgi:GDP-4-dehydro-6-deoxy-D-mannose reductase
LRALITGLTGFAGSHLAEYLAREQNATVFGLSLSGECLDDGSPICEGAEVFASDIRDAEQTTRLVGEIRPDRIYHLAALASVASSWSHPAETLTNNMVAQLNILEAALLLDPLPRVLIVGSGDEYGLVKPGELPVREDNALRPANPYAVSKIAQDYLGYQYFVSRGLPVVRVRPFNHIGPRQKPGFVVPDFSQQIAQAEAGLREPVMKVGNLSAERDFTDVWDMVRGYYLALERGEFGEVYNLGRGEAHSIKEVLDTLLALSHVDISVERDPARIRPSDVPTVICDATRFRERTGWEPVIPLRQSLADVLDYWRGRAA